VSEVIEQDREAQEFRQFLAELDPESVTLFAEAALGRDARDFFKSDIGRYLIGCAQQEYAAAMAKLKRVAWWRRRQIQKLQNEAWRAEQFMVWLRDLIVQGKAAEVALEEREETP
jgi:hypothetical protein